MNTADKISKADEVITQWVEDHRGQRDNGLPETKFTWNFEKNRWKLFGELTFEEKQTLNYGLKGKYLLAMPKLAWKGLKFREWKDEDEVIITLNDFLYYDSSEYDNDDDFVLQCKFKKK